MNSLWSRLKRLVIKQGLIATAQEIFWRLLRPLLRIFWVIKLHRCNFITTFSHEGGIQVLMPKLRFVDILCSEGQQNIDHSHKFNSRPMQEVLLRHLVYQLFELEIVDRSRSVVDIGCWLGDNAIVWAKLISGNSNVYAIDPSKENLKFAEKLSVLNNCDNVIWLNEVCMDKANLELHYLGKLDHAAFNTNGIGTKAPKKSTTIDGLIGAKNFGKIGLLHLDVEGSEKRVLEGSLEVINSSKPIVLFEQHIDIEDPFEIIDILKKFEYQTYMINEIIPDALTDCRNFLSVPRNLDISPLIGLNKILGENKAIKPAVWGGAMVPYDGVN